MSEYHEGCQLTVSEIAAVMSLAGKRTMVGFCTEEAASVTAEDVWNACCALMRDRMMTQIDGKFRLCRELIQVMQPMYQASVLIVMTPSDDRFPQEIFYGADTVTAVTKTSYGRYLLTPMDRMDVTAEITERLEISFPEEKVDKDSELHSIVEPEAPREALLQNARFVLEQLRADTGARTGWLRVVDQGIFSWLQWTQKRDVMSEPLTRSGLDARVQALLRGEL